MKNNLNVLGRKISPPRAQGGSKSISNVAGKTTKEEEEEVFPYRLLMDFEGGGGPKIA